MPSATTTKPALAGTKRKSVPVHTKESKKAKIESKSASKGRPTKKPQPKEVSSSNSSSDSGDSDSDGGVELEDAEETSPKEDHGLHPERAKAVITNSMSQ